MTPHCIDKMGCKDANNALNIGNTAIKSLIINKMHAGRMRSLFQSEKVI